ncbi:MAG: hypothetical protein ACFFDN_41200, partial [Candidatus Hodarchaeota archaeon]
MKKKKIKMALIFCLTLIVVSNSFPILFQNESNIFNLEYLNSILILKILNCRSPGDYSSPPDDPSIFDLKAANLHDFNDSNFNKNEINKLVINNFTHYLNSSQNVTHEYKELDEIEGIYEALFNFRYDTVDNDPIGWITSEEGNTDVRIVEEVVDHKKVVKLHDSDAGNSSRIQHNFDLAYQEGIIEFYIRTDNNSLLLNTTISPDQESNKTIFIYIHQEKLYLGNGTEICNFSQNWHHMKYIYNITADQWHFFINNTRFPDVGEYEFTIIDSLNWTGIKFETVLDNSFVLDAYVDAVDFSWVNGYYEGRNLNIVKNNSINELKLTENESIYQAFQNFKNTNDGELPSGWDVIEPENTDAKVISNLDGHLKVFELYDNNNTENLTVKNWFDSLKINGTVEFYFYTSALGENHSGLIQLCEYNDNNDTLSLGIPWIDNDYKLQFRNNSGIQDICYLYPGKWYHFRIEFDIYNGWYLFVDGLRYPEIGTYDYLGSPDYFYYFMTCTNNTDTKSLYLDAVDYSWSEGYYKGRNLNYELKYYNGYYISDNISIAENSLIYYVDVNSKIQENSNFNITYYDFNTYTWLTAYDYKKTKQSFFKFKVLFNSSSINSNIFLYNLTLYYYNKTISKINRPIYLNQPKDIAVDDNGFVYVADTLNNRIIKFDSDGNYLLKWGAKGYLRGQFNHPCALDISVEWDGSGYTNYIYVLDHFNNRIQKFDVNGTFILEFGG